MKVLLADTMMARHAETIQSLAGAGIEWVVKVTDVEAELCELLADAEAYVGAMFTPAMARAGGRLRLLQVTGAGYNHIDLGALPPGVVVANTFHHERAMAEYALMAMVALSRGLLQADSRLRRGVWDSVFVNPSAPVPLTLRGRAVGLVGFGHINREVARLCRPFDLRAAAVTRRPNPRLADEHGLEFIGGPADLPALLGRSDFVVVAVPSNADTRGLIGAAELARMAPTAYLINVARGPVVDEQALYDALAGRRIAGAAIDVWYNYPASGETCLPSALPFHQLDNVLLTPHYSGITQETFAGRARDVAENVRRLAAGEPLLNVVHPAPAA